MTVLAADLLFEESRQPHDEESVVDDQELTSSSASNAAAGEFQPEDTQQLDNLLHKHRKAEQPHRTPEPPATGADANPTIRREHNKRGRGRRKRFLDLKQKAAHKNRTR